MKFIPISKKEWIKLIKENEDYKHLTNRQLEDVYEKMAREAIEGIVSANALGGTWDQGTLDYSFLETLKIPNISEASDNSLIKAFKELWTLYERKLRTAFEDARHELSLTPQEVVEILHRNGLGDYASQFYILFAGVYCGCALSMKTVITDANAIAAAYKMADKLGIDVKEVDPIKALEYYKARRNENTV